MSIWLNIFIIDFPSDPLIVLLKGTELSAGSSECPKDKNNLLSYPNIYERGLSSLLP
jgi:hypothetical protein